MKILEKWFSDNELTEILQNLFKEESIDSVDYLIYTIEDIFEVDKFSARLKNNNLIKEGISEELDYKRSQISALDELLEEANKSIENKLSFRPKKVFRHFASFKTMLIPYFGYHVEIKLK